MPSLRGISQLNTTVVEGEIERLSGGTDGVTPGLTVPSCRVQTGQVFATNPSSRSSKIFQARVLPSGSADISKRRPSASKEKVSRVWLRCSLGLLAIVCLLWTVWLMLLTVAPNKTINRVMHTETFDEGTFWLLVDTPSNSLWPAMLGLGVIALGYCATIVEILHQSRKRTMTPLSRSIQSFDAMKASLERTVVDAATDRARSRIAASAAKIVVFLTQSASPRRKLMNVALKICDLMVEAILLFRILESGPPVLLVSIFTVIVVANALSCMVLMSRPSEKTGLTETLVDIFFDFLIAVGYPMIVLTHCLSTFEFDHEKWTINLEIFRVGSFEQAASVIANPAQTDIIYKSLKLLRVSSVMDVLTRLGVNSIFCFRLYRVSRRVQRPEQLFSSLYPKRSRVAGGVLIGFTIILLGFVEESIPTSDLACKPHPECVMKAHRWTMVESGSVTQCPCLTLIDADIAPKTYYEWLMPRNLTAKVAQLAATELSLLEEWKSPRAPNQTGAEMEDKHDEQKATTDVTPEATATEQCRQTAEARAVGKVDEVQDEEMKEWKESKNKGKQDDEEASGQDEGLDYAGAEDYEMAEESETGENNPTGTGSTDDTILDDSGKGADSTIDTLDSPRGRSPTPIRAGSHNGRNNKTKSKPPRATAETRATSKEKTKKDRSVPCQESETRRSTDSRASATRASLSPKRKASESWQYDRQGSEERRSEDDSPERDGTLQGRSLSPKRQNTGPSSKKDKVPLQKFIHQYMTATTDRPQLSAVNSAHESIEDLAQAAVSRKQNDMEHMAVEEPKILALLSEPSTLEKDGLEFIKATTPTDQGVRLATWTELLGGQVTNVAPLGSCGWLATYAALYNIRDGLEKPTSVVADAANILKHHVLNEILANLIEERKLHPDTVEADLISSGCHSVLKGTWEEKINALAKHYAAQRDKSVRGHVFKNFWVGPAHTKALAQHARETIYVIDVQLDKQTSIQAYGYHDVATESGETLETGTV
ncbi:10 kda heat shock protein [Phytophthora pseudosyringae]|uniref:10 kDa heat shock protein n=1 Tax=Phytophthora pseudosyringae TaxID=221518 RepID=A0A8T1VIM4_9STRA|nr:10 kda heat shock protein [Phytophthora pseudosyringae]